MVVTELYIDGFRNYNNISSSFSDSVNLVIGRNAQGKTNLIEAIYYLASGRSFRSSGDKELIGFDRDDAVIKAGILSGGREQTIEIQFTKGRRRCIFANGAKLGKAGELAGKLNAVVFCPDDLSLIKEGAAARRKLMDNSISQLRPGYVSALSEFNRLYDHKTRILRDHFEKPSLLELLDDFNFRLAQQSSRLIHYRSAFSESLSRRAALIHDEFSGGREKLEIRYKTVGDIDVSGRKPSEILPELLEHQKSHFDAELRSGLCLSGAHKDDLEIEINGKAARKYASQGQTRTAAVSIKLAERDIYHDDREEYPVLLLDDVLSELDEGRRKFILGKIEQGQVFITCCDDRAVSECPCGKTIRIENGKFI